MPGSNSVIHNEEHYKSTLHRLQKLQERNEADTRSGTEWKIANKLISRIDEKLREYEKEHNITRADFTALAFKETVTTSSEYEGCKGWCQATEAQMAKASSFDQSGMQSYDDLCKQLDILFLIFGITYITYFSYHVYKVRLLKKKDTERGEFARAVVNIFEDDILICKEIEIAFWPFHYGDTEVGDMEWSAWDYRAFRKYEEGTHTCDYLNKITHEMQDMWNSYFRNPNKYAKLMTGETQERLEGNVQNQVLENTAGPSDKAKIVPYSDEMIQKYLGMTSKYKNMLDRAKTHILFIPYKNQTMEELLQLGLVYKITPNGIAIWEYDDNKYHLLWGNGSVTCGILRPILYLNPNPVD